MAKGKSRDPMLDLLKAIKDATKENTETLKRAKAEEKLQASRDKLDSHRFQTQQKQLYQQAKALSQVGLGSVGRGMGDVGGVAKGLHGLGFSGAASALSSRAGMLGVGMAAMNTGAGAARVLHDPFATGDQKVRSLARMAPGGETLLNWADSFSGRAAGMELAKYHGEMAHAKLAGQLDKSAFALSHNPQQAGYQGTAAAYARGSAVTAGVFDRGSMGGRTAMEDAQRMLPYRQATAKAERDMATATAQRLAAQKELTRLEKVENTLVGERAKVERELAGGGSGVDRQVLHETHKVITSQIEGYNQQRRQAAMAVAEARRGEAVAGGEAAKARLRENTLGRADNLEASAQRSQASAGRLGAMNPMQRAMGLQAIKMLEGGANPDTIPEMFKSAAQAFDPEAYQMAIEKHGAGTLEFAERGRMAGGQRNFAISDYNKAYKQADTVRDLAGKEEYRLDSNVSAEVARAGSKLGKYIVDAVDVFVRSVQAETDNKFRQSRNPS